MRKRRQRGNRNRRIKNHISCDVSNSLSSLYNLRLSDATWGKMTFLGNDLKRETGADVTLQSHHC